MASFSSNEHHSFLLDSSSMFLIPDSSTSTPHQHHPFYDQADRTAEVLPSVNLSTDSTKISTCINNSSSSAASAQYQPHSKVTSKALMLDEIINYVQSLQNQVEILSLKIASTSTNTMFYDCGMNLDSYMVEPETPELQKSTSLEATKEPDARQQNHTQATNDIFNTSDGYSFTNSIFNTSGGYSIDTSALLQLQQAQMSYIMSQSQSQSDSGNRQLLWDVDEQRHKFINHSGFTNNLSSVHLH